jgi:hypothetical protein
MHLWRRRGRQPDSFQNRLIEVSPAGQSLLVAPLGATALLGSSWAVTLARTPSKTRCPQACRVPVDTKGQPPDHDRPPTLCKGNRNGSMREQLKTVEPNG